MTINTEQAWMWMFKIPNVQSNQYLFHRALSAEAGSAARSLRPRREGFVPRAERQPAGCSEAAAAGELLRTETKQR